MDSITAAMAWSLLQQCKASPGDVANRGPSNGRHELLRVHGDGSWDTALPVEPEARQMLDLYLPIALQPRYAIAQLGQSLDGHIATDSGHSRYVTGPEDIRHLHALRALVDAVIVGPGTVLADNPRLTVREVSGDNPVRVVLDPHHRLGNDYDVFQDQLSHTIILRTGKSAPPPPHVEVLTLALANGDIAPLLILRLLAERGLDRVLVEGGGRTVSRFLQAGALDRLHVTVAPLLIGSGRPGVSLPPITTMDEAVRPSCRHFQMGDDVLFDCVLPGCFGTNAPGSVDARTMSP